LILAKFPPAGMGRFSHDGRWLVPGIEVGSEVRKSVSDGPALRSSVNDVCGRRGGGCAGDAVARVRRVGFEGKWAFGCATGINRVWWRRR